MRGVTILKLKKKFRGKISTHTPHARRDGYLQHRPCSATGFLLTRLMRGVTASGQKAMWTS